MNRYSQSTREKRAKAVLLAVAGDASAFETLVTGYQDFAMAIAYGWLGDRELARDVIQEAFLEAYRQLPELRDPAAFASWLRSIVIKQCDRITRRKSLPEHLLHSDTQTPDPADLLEQSAAQQGLRQALEALPQHERMVIALRYIAEATGPTIANFLELPLSTVKARLRNAKSHLRQFTELTMSQTLNEMRLSADDSLSLEIRFFLALRRGDLDRVRDLVTKHDELLESPQDWGSDLVTRGILPFATKASPLITAIELNDLEMMSLLLDAGADANGSCRCPTGESPLWAAVLLNRKSHARILLQQGADPNQRSATGNMPLHVAAMRGFAEIARLLLDHGADPLAKDEGGRVSQHWSTVAGDHGQPPRTAFDWAQAMGETDLIELLGSVSGQVHSATTTDLQVTDEVLLSGLKALDLFAPLPRGGLVRVPFKAGIGLLVLFGELCRRFVSDPSHRGTFRRPDTARPSQSSEASVSSN